MRGAGKSLSCDSWLLTAGFVQWGRWLVGSGGRHAHPAAARIQPCNLPSAYTLGGHNSWVHIYAAVWRCKFIGQPRKPHLDGGDGQRFQGCDTLMRGVPQSRLPSSHKPATCAVEVEGGTDGLASVAVRLC